MYQFTSDFNNLERFLEKNAELTEYLNNPIISKAEKEEILTKLFKSRLNTETFNFIMVLVKRDRIELLLPIINAYIDSIYELARVRTMELYTAVPITVLQKNTLVTKLKKLTDSREIRLFIYVDPSLIGGFLIKTSSKVIDFTVKNQLKKLAKHLDSILEI